METANEMPVPTGETKTRRRRSVTGAMEQHSDFFSAAKKVSDVVPSSAPMSAKEVKDQPFLLLSWTYHEGDEGNTYACLRVQFPDTPHEDLITCGGKVVMETLSQLEGQEGPFATCLHLIKDRYWVLA